MAEVMPLPNELWMHIFSFLSPPDIKQARLSCRDFKAWSSGFLITRVIFARRRETLDTFKQIIEHPIFRLSVRELVFDASFYMDCTADDYFRQYVSLEPIRVPLNSPFYQQVFSGGTEYRQRYLEERGIRLGEDKRLLEQTFSTLPQLRQITFADFLYTIPEGSNCMQHVLDRFGAGRYVMPPSRLPNDITFEGYGDDWWYTPYNDLLDLIRLVSKSTATITSISIPRPPVQFHRLSGTTGPCAYSSGQRASYIQPYSLPIDFFTLSDPDYAALSTVFQRLQHIRFPIGAHFHKTAHLTAPNPPRIAALLANAKHLTHLMLEGPRQHQFRGLRCRERPLICESCDPKAVEMFSFASLFADKVWPRLTRFDLRRWAFNTDHFEAFVMAQPTLKELRLCEDTLLGGTWTEVCTALSRRICLSGVEFSRLSYSLQVDQLVELTENDARDVEAVLLGDRPNAIEREKGMYPTNRMRGEPRYLRKAFHWGVPRAV
ncbi:hypothetical protein BU16DRAFT_528538 [Lophium mytilinum]|uniref:F-box domain-containing protein n=1 Tax=Lophium mytilinum TaxID=390894 RepID=A0A6A6QM66_9PEZI|nr:hypothetical protein BU16DRAFT_528538 [Lophium mytilinum]